MVDGSRAMVGGAMVDGGKGMGLGFDNGKVRPHSQQESSARLADDCKGKGKGKRDVTQDDVALQSSTGGKGGLTTVGKIDEKCNNIKVDQQSRTKPKFSRKSTCERMAEYLLMDPAPDRLPFSDEEIDSFPDTVLGAC